MAFERWENNEARPEVFEQKFEWENDVANGDRAAMIVQEELVALGWPDDQADFFAHAVEEAVINAIVHGNLELKRENGDHYLERIAEARAAHPDKRVRVHFRFTDNEAMADIKDEGNFVPAPEDMERYAKGGWDNAAESGRGMKLIFEGGGDVDFSPGRIVMRKRRESGDLKS